jgi:hypothetical protein
VGDWLRRGLHVAAASTRRVELEPAGRTSTATEWQLTPCPNLSGFRLPSLLQIATMNGMDYATPQPTAPPKSRHRWFRFGLRTILIAVTLFCIWLGITANRANRQRRAVATIRKAGGEVWYDYECDDNGKLIPNASSPPGPNWLRNLIGIDYFATVVDIRIPNEKGANDDSFAAVAELSQLRRLGVEGKGVTDSMMAETRSLTQLHSLLVTNSSVTEGGWASLEHFSSLNNLVLKGPNVTDSTLLRIRDLTSLTELFLVNAQVTDIGLKHLKELARLEYLDLVDSSRITDASLEHLKTLTHLQYLNIKGTMITDAGVRGLRRALPKVTIIGP